MTETRTKAKKRGGWNYRVMRHVEKVGANDETFYAVHEVYYNADDTVSGWTADVCGSPCGSPCGDPPSEIRPARTPIAMTEAAAPTPVTAPAPIGDETARLIERLKAAPQEPLSPADYFSFVRESATALTSERERADRAEADLTEWFREEAAFNRAKGTPSFAEYSKKLKAAEAETARLTARVAELKGALKPFAHTEHTYNRVSRDGWTATLTNEVKTANRVLHHAPSAQGPEKGAGE